MAVVKSTAKAKTKAAAEKEPLVCEGNCLHEKTVAQVRKGLSIPEDIDATAELFKALADPTRLRIVNALLLSEICVCDVAALFGMSQPAVSHHLKVLRAARLVRTRRDGKTIYYSLDDEHVANIFYQGLLHASHR
ncbi:MAG: metalloregulator ArsR/SmtB family transcription factor [Clostridiales Family XIII bacterium]|jgi:ArsR family transcriptional regulator|nr:metalloregulator ArsR/SmtB family transcription factor [Clostridiales Family XIII bacterium]